MEKETNNFNTSVEALLKGMNSFVTSKTVVGEPVCVNDAIILPLIDVQFGVGAGAFAGNNSGRNKNNAAGGAGAKMSPNAVLVIQGGYTRLISVKSQDTVTKIIDMVPDVINRFTSKGKPAEDPAVEAKVDEILSPEE